MESHTVPEDEWFEFVDRFSRDYVGSPVSIEVLAGESGPQLVAGNLPLQGISFDVSGSRPSSIEISAGGEMGGHVTHVIDMPLHIRRLSHPDGVDLAIEPARGSVTLIHVSRSIH
jgi:hypothetical protein